MNSGELRNENAEAFENILKQYGKIVQPVSTTFYRDVNVPNGNRFYCIVLNRELPDSIDYESTKWRGLQITIEIIPELERKETILSTLW